MWQRKTKFHAIVEIRHYVGIDGRAEEIHSVDLVATELAGNRIISQSPRTAFLFRGIRQPLPNFSNVAFGRQGRVA